MGNLAQLFCKHNWESRDKVKKMTETWMQNILGKYEATGMTQEFTKEILICKKCGKIKVLKY